MSFVINFTGLGAPKCGTTWLARQLELHPDINFCAAKETNYFASEKLINLFKRDFETMRKVDDVAKYQNLYDKSENVRGEYSVYYMYDKDTLENIYKNNKNMKVIVCLRNPVEASVSQYNYEKNSIRGTKMKDDILKEVESNELYLKKYRYSSYLKLVLGIFGSQNTKIVLFDDIRSKPEAVLKDVYGFLGVDDSFRTEGFRNKNL